MGNKYSKRKKGHDYFLGVINCQGIGPFSDKVKKMLDCQTTHTAVVLTGSYDSTTKILSPKGDNFYAIEATHPEGIGIKDLCEWLKGYSGSTCIRVIENCRDVINDEKRKMIYEYINELVKNNVKYEESEKDFEIAKEGPHGLEKEDLSHFYCTELAASMYRKIGMLPETVSANSYIPLLFHDEEEKNRKRIKEFKEKCKEMKLVPDDNDFYKNEEIILLHPYKFVTVEKFIAKK